jgi:alpha-beta hydrolase superfamily lysophospholipase
MHQLVWRPSAVFPGARLALHWWRNIQKTEIPLRGYVWISHGIGEHGKRYEELATYLCQCGFDVLAQDHPGHGLSATQGGATRLPSIDECVQELRAARIFWAKSGPLAKPGLVQTPWYILGHSFGAMIAMAWVLEGRLSEDEGDFAVRAFASAIPFRLRMPVPQWKVEAARVLKNFKPDLRMKNEIDPEMLSHDVANVGRYRSDPLVHPWASPRLFFSLRDHIDTLLASPHDIEIPLCLAVGAEDPIVDPAAIRQYFDALGTHKSFLEFPHSKHEIFNEVARERAYEAVASWFI